MIPGVIFFYRDFPFKNGATGRKLFLVLGSKDSIAVVVKTTSRQHGRSAEHGCHPEDRFHNYYLPRTSCALKGETWICLDQFYELNFNHLLQKHFSGEIDHKCDLSRELTRDIQKCAIESPDISSFQEQIIKFSM